MSFIKNTLFLIIAVFFIVSLLIAFDPSYTGNIVKENFSARYAFDHAEETINDYNSNFENLPNLARTLLGNERINLTVNMNDNSIKQLGLITKNGKIISYSKKTLENPTVYVTLSEDTMNSISFSSNPSKDFANAIQNKDISIESKRTVTGIKVYISKLFLKIRNLF